MIRKAAFAAVSLALFAMTLPATAGEADSKTNKQTVHSSQAAPPARKAAPAGSGEKGSPQNKAEELAAGSKKRHDDARQVINNLKD